MGVLQRIIFPIHQKKSCQVDWQKLVFQEKFFLFQRKLEFLIEICLFEWLKWSSNRALSNMVSCFGTSQCGIVKRSWKNGFTTQDPSYIIRLKCFIQDHWSLSMQRINYRVNGKMLLKEWNYNLSSVKLLLKEGVVVLEGLNYVQCHQIWEWLGGPTAMWKRGYSHRLAVITVLYGIQWILQA